MNAVPATAANRRQFRRVRVDADARVYSDRAMWPTKVVDIGLRGALTERPKEWAGSLGKTQRLEIRFHALLIVSVNATVAHISNRFIGYHFQRMDLDSFMRLKRIVELNLGDPVLLTRELEATLAG